ncbi:hypothetical protein WMF26_37275 [Sorangium sp. So ce185]|uniref:hypothetical protein n=1 Tax=Sorangium sp. So ce185 TaxID=3133287 RepID=UPI003F603FEF
MPEALVPITAGLFELVQADCSASSVASASIAQPSGISVMASIKQQYLQHNSQLIPPKRQRIAKAIFECKHPP